MAHEIPGFVFSARAGEDLSTLGQFRAVALEADGDVIRAGAGAQIVGVCQNNPPNGGTAEVMHSGITKMRVGAGQTIAINDRIASDAAGEAAVAAGGNARIGRALSAGGAGALVSVLLGADNVTA